VATSKHYGIPLITSDKYIIKNSESIEVNVIDLRNIGSLYWNLFPNYSFRNWPSSRVSKSSVALHFIVSAIPFWHIKIEQI
jgi:hypothetical protein